MTFIFEAKVGDDVDLDALREVFAASAGEGVTAADVLIEVYLHSAARSRSRRLDEATTRFRVVIATADPAALIAVFDDAAIVETVQTALGDDVTVTVTTSAEASEAKACGGSIANCDDDDDDDDGGLSGGAIAGIIVGALVGVGLLAACAYKATRPEAEDRLTLKQKHERDVELQGNSKV